MPFDPDELANGMMRWLENGRKPKPAPAEPNPYDPGVIYQNPEPSPPPAEMPGSGPSIEELQDQIKALQEQLKALQGDGGAQLIPTYPRDRSEPDDAFKYPQPVPMPTYPRNNRPYRPHPDDDDIKADMPSWGPYGQPGAKYDDIKADMPSWGPYKNEPRGGYGGYEYDIVRPNPFEEIGPEEKPNWRTLPDIIRPESGPQEKPNWENLPDRYKQPMNEAPYELLNGTGSPVEGLNLKVGRHGNNYSPSTVTPGKGASLN